MRSQTPGRVRSDCPCLLGFRWVPEAEFRSDWNNERNNGQVSGAAFGDRGPWPTRWAAILVQRSRNGLSICGVGDARRLLFVQSRRPPKADRDAFFAHAKEKCGSTGTLAWKPSRPAQAG